MADKILRNLSYVAKVIEFKAGQIVPVIQVNIDCGEELFDGDYIVRNGGFTHLTVPRKLTVCAFTVDDTASGRIFPNGFVVTPPLNGTAYKDLYSDTLGPDTITYRVSVGHSSRHNVFYSSPKFVINNQPNDRVNGYLDYSISSNLILGWKQMVSPSYIFYDVVGSKFISCGSSFFTLTPSINGVTDLVNIYGVIKTNINPQYVVSDYGMEPLPDDENRQFVGFNSIMNTWLQNKVFNQDNYRPYNNIEPTVEEEGPGIGDWALPADLVTEGGSPYSDLEAGLYRVYAMTASQVSSFSDQLWNGEILDIIARFLERPQDVVISLKSFPFDVAHGTDENIEFRWISEWVGVNVTGGPVTQEIQVIDFGSKYVPRYSGLFFDYQPYSSLQLHLPYIGFVPLKMNEVIGKTLRVKYYVNVVTGDFTAHVTTDGNPLKNIGYYQGTIARELPLSSDDTFALVKKGAEIAAAAVMATGYGVAGAIEGAAAQKIGGDIVQEVSNGNSQATESPRFAMAVTHEEKADYYTKEFKRHASHAIGNALQSIGSVNAPIARSGNLDGMNGRTSSQEVFYIMSVPHPNIPSNQQILGYPANLAGPLKNYTGYTTVREIRLSSAIATSSELAELEGILRGGIVI